MPEAIPSPAPRAGTIANLWPLALIVLLLLVVTVLSLVARGATGATGQQAPGEQGSVAALVERVLDKSQRTTFVLVAVLAVIGFGRLVPVLWSLCQASVAGLLIATEIGLVLWLVYGG